LLGELVDQMYSQTLENEISVLVEDLECLLQCQLANLDGSLETVSDKADHIAGEVVVITLQLHKMATALTQNTA